MRDAISRIKVWQSLLGYPPVMRGREGLKCIEERFKYKRERGKLAGSVYNACTDTEQWR